MKKEQTKSTGPSQVGPSEAKASETGKARKVMGRGEIPKVQGQQRVTAQAQDLGSSPTLPTYGSSAPSRMTDPQMSRQSSKASPRLTSLGQSPQPSSGSEGAIGSIPENRNSDTSPVTQADFSSKFYR